MQFGDLIDFVDFDFTARVGRVNAAAMWSLSQAPGEYIKLIHEQYN